MEELAWLSSPEGRDVCASMELEPADTPAAIGRWRERLPAERVACAWGQVLLRRAAKEKFERAGAMLFDRVALEQATGQTVAEYKARRFRELGRLADLCCGIGGDALALAYGRELVALDLSAARLEMARHNAAMYGHGIETRQGDAAFDRPEAEAIHVDPDRRPANRREHDPEAGSPNLQQLGRIVEHYHHAAIKLSPGMDPESLPFDAELELISERGNCKQAIAWTGKLHQAFRRATALPSGESIVAHSEDELAWPSTEPPRAGRLLAEPDAAVVRANLVGVLARRCELAPVDPQIAYLTGEHLPRTPLLRGFRILDTHPWSLRAVRAWLGGHDVGRLEIKTRGFAVRPEEILPRLKLSGRRDAVLFLTRLGASPLAILAERADDEGTR